MSDHSETMDPEVRMAFAGILGLAVHSSQESDRWAEIALLRSKDPEHRRSMVNYACGFRKAVDKAYEILGDVKERARGRAEHSARCHGGGPCPVLDGAQAQQVLPKGAGGADGAEGSASNSPRPSFPEAGR